MARLLDRGKPVHPHRKPPPVTEAARTLRLSALRSRITLPVAAAVFVAVVIVWMSVVHGGNRVSIWAPAAAISGVFLLVFVLLHASPPPPRSAFWGLMALVSGGGFAMLQSLGIMPVPWPEFAANVALQVSLCAVLFLIVVRLTGHSQARSVLLLTLFTGIALHCIWALATDPRHATGGFIYRNGFASFAGQGGVIGLAILAGAAGPVAAATLRAPVAVLTLVCFAAVLASGSRLGALSCLAGCALFTALSGPRWWHLALMLFATIVLTGASGPVLDRIPLVNASAVERWELYTQIWQLIRSAPLTGSGAGAFVPAFETARSSGLPAGLSYDHAHNSYLAAWVAFGPIAGSLLFLFLLGALATCLRHARSCPHSRLGAAALTMAALHASGDFTYQLPANATLLSVVLALALTSKAMQ